MKEISEKLYNETTILADFIHIIETLHNETQVNIEPFLSPIVSLPEFSFFQHVAENTDDKYIKESYAIFQRLCDDLLSN